MEIATNSFVIDKSIVELVQTFVNITMCSKNSRKMIIKETMHRSLMWSMPLAQAGSLYIIGDSVFLCLCPQPPPLMPSLLSSSCSYRSLKRPPPVKPSRPDSFSPADRKPRPTVEVKGKPPSLTDIVGE